VIHVVTAVITAKGEYEMTTSTAETQETALASVPKATTKPRARAQKPRVAPSKGKSGKKTTPAKKSTKAPKKAEAAKAEGVREGTKTEKVLELLKRPGGTTMRELMKVTGWLPHSVRGFLSGTIGKKMRLAVTSVKGEDGNRNYSIKG
jgi:Protein of unknown function (DUF3489)